MAEQMPYRAMRGAFRPRALRWGPIVGLTLFVVFLAVRLPFVSEYPVNWDSVQYLLGIDTFDLQRHQPHPPGYIGYIMLGRLVSLVTGEAHLALVMLSILGGAIATVAMYALSRCWLDRRLSIMTAVLFGTSPLVWYYSGVALNYMIEVAVVIPLVWMCYRARVNQSWSDLILATLLLTTLGALRQSGFVLLMPLWIYTAWVFPWRQRIKVGAFLGATVLVWLVPLLWLAGGPITYIEESRALGDLVSSEATPLAKLQEHGGYLAQMLIALGLGLTGALVVLIGYRTRAMEAVRSLSRHDRWFFCLWAGPSILTFVFGHFGQLGYVLTILPIAFLWVGAVLARLGSSIESLRPASPAAIAAAVVVANTLAFVAIPDAATRITSSDILGDTEKASISLRQYDVESSDAYWEDAISDVRGFPTDSTVVLTTVGGPRVSGAYRHLSYYLPEFRVYGLGRDQHGVFGHMFQTLNGDSNYSVAGLQSARPVVPLADDVRYIVTPDPKIIDQIHESLDPRTVKDSDLVYFRRPEGMNLAFLPEENMVACNCPGMTLVARPTEHERGSDDVTGS